MINRLTPEEVENVLKENKLGRIGCGHGNEIYIVPTHYVYDGRDIIAHSFEGKKIDLMRRNPEVCFEVDEVKDFSNWKSVIVWGMYQEFTRERDRYYALQLFADKMLQAKMNIHDNGEEDFEPQYQDNFVGKIKPVFYRIVPAKKTGRYESNTL